MSFNNLKAILYVANNEFNKVLRHPLILVISALVLVLVYLNGAGGSKMLPIAEDFEAFDVYYLGLRQLLSDTGIISTVVAAFLGVISISEDRSKKLLNTLISKPLYRRDIIIGKFFGVTAFMFILISMMILGTGILVMLYFRMPYSIMEFILRTFSYIIILFLACSLTVAIAMLFGIFFKNFIESVALTVTYLFVEYFGYLTLHLQIIFGINNLNFISPHILYYNILDVSKEVSLFNTAIPYFSWLNASFPYILLITLEILVFIALDCIIFTKIEEL